MYDSSLTLVAHNLVSLAEEAAMLQVHDLTLQFIFHHVNQAQLIAQVLVNTRLVRVEEYNPYRKGYGYN